MKKQRDSDDIILYVTLIGVVIITAAGIIRGDNKYPDLKLGQEMRCDYQGCIIIDKPQPFTGYNNSGLSTGE